MKLKQKIQKIVAKLFGLHTRAYLENKSKLYEDIIKKKDCQIDVIEKNKDKLNLTISYLKAEKKDLEDYKKSLYNQKSKYYMRCRNIIKYINEQKPNNMTKKHFAKIVDIADGASNDGKVTNRGN